MQSSRGRRRTSRVPRFESIEPRVLLSAEPVGQFWPDYYVENSLYDENPTLLGDFDDLTGLSHARDAYGFTGSGQTVAVIDSGIAYSHPALGGGFGAGYQVVGGFDFTEEQDADPYDDGPLGSHGTHVAGIIAGNDSTATGVAPGVELVGLRVFNDVGYGEFGWVENALQWVHKNRNAFENPITTVNLSLGGGGNADSPPTWAMLEDELALLAADGIFVAAAAGNSFTSYNEPGLSYPAVSPHVVPVGSVDGDGNLSYFSQRDGRIIAAPGRGITSTVPDYAGNGNGIDDDFARYSGTSMAAPYVAGASVLLREAFQFVGVDNASPEMLYDLMVTTADTVYDSVTAANYHRLNLGRALDAVMPDDDFGSSRATAYSLGTIADTRSLSGTIASLNDQDWFRFTAASNGSMTVEVHADGDLTPKWQLSGAAKGTTGSNGTTLSFDVVAGETYKVAMSTGDGLGHYDLDFELEATFDYTDWGTVSQQSFDGQPVDADGEWFAVTAAADGILTIEALFSRTAGDVDLQLFDADHRPIAVGNVVGDSVRIDVTASAGETFYLHARVPNGDANEQVDFRVTNLVSHDGETVHVRGTGGDDHLAFAAGATYQVTVNGVAYQFDAAVVDFLSFNGRGGWDAAVLVGSDGEDHTVLRVGSTSLAGAGYHVEVTNVETVTVQSGGGADQAEFYDSTSDDIFLATPHHAQLSGDGFLHRSEGFRENHAYATEGGTDVAKLTDSRGNDTFLAAPNAGMLFGEGFSNRAEFFEGIHAYAVAGGTDTALLFDSSGDDRFVADHISGALFGDGFYNRAKHFEGIHAYAAAGGVDAAYLRDSAGNDTLVVDPIFTALFGEGFYNAAKYFEEVYAEGQSGGDDRAYIYDSAADDYFRASGSQARISYGASATLLYGFEYVRADAGSGGTNKAEIAAVDYILQLEGDWE